MGLGEALEQAARASGSHDRERGGGRGMGIAGSAYISGAGLPIYWNDMPHSGAVVTLDRGGGVLVSCGTAEIGQGSDMMLASVAAEELGVVPEDVHVVSGDTALAPVDLGSYSSRVTFMAGNAVRMAAAQLRGTLLDVAGEKLGVPVDRLACAFRRIYDTSDPERYLGFVDAV